MAGSGLSVRKWGQGELVQSDRKDTVALNGPDTSCQSSSPSLWAVLNRRRSRSHWLVTALTAFAVALLALAGSAGALLGGPAMTIVSVTPEPGSLINRGDPVVVAVVRNAAEPVTSNLVLDGFNLGSMTATQEGSDVVLTKDLSMVASSTGFSNPRPDGPHTVVLTVTGADGEQATKTWSYTSDHEPWVRIFSPEYTSSAGVSAHFYVRDFSTCTYGTVSTWNARVDNNFLLGNKQLFTTGPTWHLAASAAVTMTPGVHTVTLFGNNGNGHTFNITRQFTVLPAGISVETGGISDGQTLPSGDFSAVATITSGASTITKRTFLLDGAPVASTLVTSTMGGFVERWRVGAGLAAGSHQLVVAASNALGNATTQTVNFSVQPPASEFSVDGISQGAVLTGPSVSATVTVNCPEGPLSATEFRVDGSSLAVQEISRTPSGDAKTVRFDTDLAEGQHTLFMSATGPYGTVTTRTIDFSTLSAPDVWFMRPAPAEVVTDTTPLIRVRADSLYPYWSPIFKRVLIDGSNVPFTQISSPYDTAEARAQVTTPLADEMTHTATVVVEDKRGLVTTRTWEFRVSSAPRMPHFDARSACTDCHTSPATVHATGIVYTTGYDCRFCHTDPKYGNNHYVYFGNPLIPSVRSTYMSPSFCTCHKPNILKYGERWTDAHVSWGNASACRSCHTKVLSYNQEMGVSSGRGLTAPLFVETPRHDVDGASGACRPCHYSDLTTEHAGRFTDAGQPIDCTTCHSSADASVQAAITTGDTRCDACHSGYDHPHPAAVLTGLAADGEQPCLTCHSADIVVEHSKPTSAGSANPCQTCHAAGGARSRLSGSWDRSCTTAACHGPESAQPIHRSYCSACHATTQSGFAVNKTNFTSIGSVDRSVACPRCHDQSLAGTHPNHYAGGNCGAVCHKGVMGQSSLLATPRVITPFGAFARLDSLDASAADLHALHAGDGWAGQVTKGSIHCGSCHAAAACDACHSGTIPSGHATHGATGDAQYPARLPQERRVCYGVPAGDQTFDSVQDSLSQCAVPECHDPANALTVRPVRREDFSHPAIGDIPANVVVKTGAWSSQTGTAFSLQRRSISNKAGSTLGIDFVGNRVAVIGGKGPNFGSAEVLIDGAVAGVVDLYSPSMVTQTTVFDSGVIPAGAHTVTVRVTGVKSAGSTGTYVAVDGFDVWDRTPTSLVPRCSGCHTDRAATHY